MPLPPQPPPKPLVLFGRVVTFDDERPVIEDGAVYVGPDQRFAAVQARTDPWPAGFPDDALRLETKGAIYPGLMDLHGHIVYNGLPLWSPRGVSEPYETHDQWPDEDSYEGLISDPANAIGALAGKGILKYCEVKAVIGGSTAIQGSTKMAYPYDGWLVRNVEFETFMTGEKSVFQSVQTLGRDDFERVRGYLHDGDAFINHVAEGRVEKLLREYEPLKRERLLRAGFCGIHCTALTSVQYGEWMSEVRGADPQERGSLIWSPFSNLWLYGETADIPAAKAAGMRVCLGADWSPSGSKNVLGELKVADLVNRTEFGGQLSDEELCRMATCNPADALRWSDKLGRIRQGLHADFLVLSDRGGDPYRNLISATENDVMFVAINGYPFYGTTALMNASKAVNAEPISVGGRVRRIVLVYDWIKDADWPWAKVIADINAAKRDPVARYLEIEHLHELGKPPPWLMTDKPSDSPNGKPFSVTVHIPRLDPLTHGPAYFNAVERHPIHGGKLDGLRSYYSED
jgi:5-methylthioadenosine/S-adenosylhomocysteine deaminase